MLRTPFAASPAERVAVAIALVGMGGLGFLPLFGGPGYEAALAAGLVLPTTAAVTTALGVAKDAPSPLRAFERGAVLGAALGGVGLAVTLLHGLRAGFCDPLEGAELFALGPLAGAVLGGVWGAFTGLFAGRRRKSVLVGLALAGPLGGIAASVVRFYTSPMVFAFDPFFGFFAGTLYDSVITGLDRLLTYRAGTLATLVFAGSLSALVRRDADGALRFDATGRASVALLALVALAGSVTHTAMGASLGHFQTTASIRQALGQRLDGARCELVYPTGTPEIEARAVLRECDGHVSQLERFFGTGAPPKIVAFLFASADQKGYLMGAAGTYIAKPWRREIYVQRAGYPHPVLRHELAHVVAGGFGKGPFRVSGPLGGLVPDPGRIEGVAVAAAPRDEELSLDEWARAMKDLKLLPPLGRVFKLSFLGEPSSRAYVVAGAFIDWLRREKGIDAVRRWYGGASLEAAAGATLAELERAWHRNLDALTVSPEALSVARARFDQPAIFGRKCPHVVDRLSQEAGSALGAADTAHARELYGSVLALDPHDLGARLGLASCAEREGKTEKARELYGAVATDASLGATVRARAVETLGDRALAAGDAEEAVRRFDEVARVVVDPDRVRTLDVKRWAARASDTARRALAAHLFGDPRLGRDPALAAESLAGWAAAEPDLGLPEYLLARIHVSSGRWDLAAPRLDRALGKSIPVPSVVREALRLRLVSACALDDRAGALRAYERWSSLPGPRPSERTEAAAFVERCTGTRPDLAATGPPSAAPPTPPAAQGSPAQPSPDGEACPEGMVKIPEAKIFVGSPRGEGIEDEWPRYETRVAAFCMDRTEVTVGAYRACMSRGKCTPADSERVTCTLNGHGDAFPINCVDWNQASAFCAERGARLPTEAEWEYAASGGDARTYSWGNEPPDDRTCWKTNGACEVGKSAPGAFGLVDMTGNVWEWTSDGYGDYPWPPVESPSKVYRGGSWSRRFEKWMRVRLRNRGTPSMRGSHLGFRCAKTLLAAPCPFERAPDGRCYAGVLGAECREGRAWNGVRCAEPGEQGCAEGRTFVPGHGCVRDVPVDEPAAPAPDLAAVHRTRAPEFDGDCGTFQAKAGRPHAYRLEGGTHDARNQVGRSLGCKNRDVGVGWNSACCP